MSGRILIADEVSTNRIVMKVRLSTASYDVIQACTGAEAAELAVSEAADLVILDMSLPDLGGIEVCRMLRKNPETAHLPIILVSARSDNAIRAAALEAGADDFLPKPLDEMLLLARVRNLLRGKVAVEELRLRQSTALELGFAEAKSGFQHRPKVALSASRTDLAVAWRKKLEARLDADIEVLPKEKVLESIGQNPHGPDVLVIPTDPSAPTNGLILLAELRSRHETRHSAILVQYRAEDRGSAVSALDMGANDVFLEGCSAEEMALRIRRQLALKLEADRLRTTVEDGLRMAMIDPLTGLFNRRYALPHLTRIAARSATTGKPFAVMVLDLDRFKLINDAHGHSAGDSVLVEVAARIRKNLRSIDLVARIGGEEFLVVMPDTDSTAARVAAERLRKHVSSRPVALPNDGGDLTVTISIGVSIGGQAASAPLAVETLFDQADQALMGAKLDGRNQTLIALPAA